MRQCWPYAETFEGLYQQFPLVCNSSVSLGYRPDFGSVPAARSAENDSAFLRWFGLDEAVPTVAERLPFDLRSFDGQTFLARAYAASAGSCTGRCSLTAVLLAASTVCFFGCRLRLAGTSKIHQLTAKHRDPSMPFWRPVRLLADYRAFFFHSGLRLQPSGDRECQWFDSSHWQQLPRGIVFHSQPVYRRTAPDETAVGYQWDLPRGHLLLPMPFPYLNGRTDRTG